MKQSADLRHIPPLLLALLVALVPQMFEMPFWITLWCFLCWGYELLVVKRGWPRPNRPALLTLAGLGFFGTMLTFGGAFYSESYVGLLALMCGLKPLEIHAYRDKIFTLFLAYFLVITNLFYNDALPITFYMFFSVLVTTTVLIHLHHPASRSRKKLRLATVIMLQAMPVTIVLFYLFPRIEGNIWGMTRQSSGRSGFSEQMSPGSISRIVENNALAFRVQFAGEIPPPEKRYWRGIVFVLFDGRNWRQGIRAPVRRPNLAGAQPVDYTITMEPHDDRWLFALEMPGSIPERGFYMSDHTIVSRHTVSDRKLYRMRSYLEYRTGELQQWESATLRLPKGGNPRTRALAAEWVQTSGGDPRAIVQAALRFFRDNGFVYTLEPPLLGRDPIDEFLFETRKGYCEHYASAFSVLMRAANIPARVVGGYQGGEVNPYGDYLIVRQSHAHAWAEVWVEDWGWTRVDPTAAVAPDRIENGVEAALSPEDQARLVSLPDLGALTDYLRIGQFGWDAVNAYWNLWVMGYTAEDQQGLLSRLGVRTDSWQWMLKTVLIACGIVALFTFLFAGIMYARSGRKRDRLQRIYFNFCRKLDRTGLSRGTAEGPVDYARRVSAARPDLKEPVLHITELYVRLRYGRDNGNREVLKRLRAMVRRFNTRKQN